MRIDGSAEGSACLRRRQSQGCVSIRVSRRAIASISMSHLAGAVAACELVEEPASADRLGDGRLDGLVVDLGHALRRR